MNCAIKLAGLASLCTVSLMAHTAGAVPCGPAYETNVTGDVSNSNSGCALGSINNDKLNPLQVNIDMLFGGGWTFAEKATGAGSQSDEDIDIGLQVSGGARSGTWGVVSTFFDTYDDLLLVFKGGNGSDPSTYVGYLFDSGDGTTGDYDTPFINPNGKADNPADISHFSAYVRSSAAPVPLPGALPLLLGAMGAGLYASRRRNRSS